jgi:hypothetical protein
MRLESRFFYIVQSKENNEPVVTSSKLNNIIILQAWLEVVSSQMWPMDDQLDHAALYASFTLSANTSRR